MEEFKNFGWNPQTICTLGTMLFAVLGAFGMNMQRKRMSNLSSEEAISAIWHITFVGMFLAFFIEGLYQGRLAMIFVSVIRIALYIPIIKTIRKIRKFTKVEIRLFWICAVGLVPMLIPFGNMHTVIYTSFQVIGIWAAADQPLKIYQNKSPGAVSIGFIWIFWGSMWFWVAYSYFFGSWLLLSIMIPYWVIYLVTIVLWYWYHSKNKNVKTKAKLN